jgi:hypothetical protein
VKFDSWRGGHASVIIMHILTVSGDMKTPNNSSCRFQEYLVTLVFFYTCQHIAHTLKTRVCRADRDEDTHSIEIERSHGTPSVRCSHSSAGGAAYKREGGARFHDHPNISPRPQGATCASHILPKRTIFVRKPEEFLIVTNDSMALSTAFSPNGGMCDFLFMFFFFFYNTIE